MMKRLILGLILLALVFPGTAPLSAAKLSQAAPAVDLVSLLAPPPAQDSDQARAELKELVEIQKKRTKEQEAYAQGDVEKDVFRFADVLGDKFKEADLPLTAALFKEVVAASKASVDPAKKFFDRTRPYAADKDINPCVKVEGPGESYPSGHATAGTAMAVILAQMVPEKKAEIFARGWAFAYNRMVGGVHYHSDIEAGRIAGTLIGYRLLETPSFRKEYKAAKAELRGALDLPQTEP